VTRRGKMYSAGKGLLSSLHQRSDEGKGPGQQVKGSEWEEGPQRLGPT
jgi:hypothetical protein